MKHLIVLISLISLFSFTNASAQNLAYVDTSSEIITSENTIEHPTYVKANIDGCELEKGIGISDCTIDKIVSELNENIEYPNFAKEYFIEQRCHVYFNVDKSGNIDDIQVLKCNEKVFTAPITKALESIELTPAKYGDDAIDYNHNLYVNFTIQ